MKTGILYSTIRACISATGFLAAFVLPALPALGQTPLTINCPTNRIVWTCDTNAVQVTFPAPTTTGGCTPNIVKFCTPASGSFFAVNTTNTVTCRASDGCVTQICTFTITVRQDISAPSISCPSNITVWTCGTNPVPVSYPLPTAIDDSDPNPVIHCTPSSGSLFSAGTNQVICDAMDICGHLSRSCAFTVTVLRDSSPPSITCPSILTVQCLSAVPAHPTTLSQFLAQGGQASDNLDLNLTYSSSDAPLVGGTCGGTIRRTHTATDDCTNSASCVQIITVNDTVPPSVTCPSNRIVNATSSNGAVVTFAATASDNCNATPAVTCTPPSGSLFPIGTNTVVCQALDACGNAGNCSFTVTVVQGDISAVIRSLVEQNEEGFIVNWQVPGVPEYDGYSVLPVARIEFQTDHLTPVTYDFQMIFSLVDDGGQPVPILNENGQPDTAYRVTDTITLPSPVAQGGENLFQPASVGSLIKTYQARLQPKVQLAPGKLYALKLSLIKRVAGAGAFSPAASPFISTPKVYYHFPGQTTPDAGVNVIATLKDGTWTHPYLVNTVAGKDEARVQLQVELRREDDVMEGPKEDLIIVHLKYQLRQKGSQELVPLAQTASIMVTLMPSYSQTPIKDFNKPSVKIFTEEIPIRPAGGYQLDPVNGEYELTVFISHEEETGQVPAVPEDDLALPTQRLLHFNGTLTFGDIATVVTSISNDPEAGSLVPGGIRSHLQVDPAGAYLIGSSSHKCGDGTSLPVVLRADGVAEYSSSVPVALKRYFLGIPVSDQDSINQVKFSRVNLSLSASGGVGDYRVTLPTGFGYRFDLTSRLLKSVSTHTQVKFDQQLLPVIDPILAGPLYACEETKPLWIEASSITWKVDLGQFVLAPTGLHYVRTNELADLEALPIDPTLKKKRSNELYFRWANAVTTSQVVIASDARSNAVMQLELDFRPGEFTTHFPYDVTVTQSGGQMAVENDLVGTQTSQLWVQTPVPVQYARDCFEPDCMKGGAATLSITPSNQVLWFTEDGGLHARGSVQGEGAHLTALLEWGWVTTDTFPSVQDFTHRTITPFVTGNLHLPGCFLRGDQTNGLDLPKDAALFGPGVLLLTGVRAGDLTDIERPGSGEYTNHNVFGDYAGLNFNVGTEATTATSLLAARPFGPYQLRSRSKYYVRYWGVSGVHEAEDGTFPGAAEFYNYKFSMANFSLAFLGSQNTDSRTEGSIYLPVPSNHEQKFEELTLQCNGALIEAQPPPSDFDDKHLLAHWNANFFTRSIRFDHNPALDCSPTTGYLVLGVQAEVSHLDDQPLFGELGFQTNGTILTPAFSALQDLTVTSRLDLPNNLVVKGPSNEKYQLTPVGQAYFSDYDAWPSSGFINFAARVAVPFFEDLQAHVQIDPVSAGDSSKIYLMGGWADSEAKNKGWKDGVGNYYFGPNRASFDPNHVGFPLGAVAVASPENYRRQEPQFDFNSENYLVRARRKWLDQVDFDLPLRWNLITRSFRSLSQVKPVLVLDMHHEAKHLSPDNVELSFGAQYDGVPNINIATLGFSEASGAAAVVQNALGSEISAPIVKGLKKLDIALDAQMHALIHQPLSEAFTQYLQGLHNSLSGSFENQPNLSAANLEQHLVDNIVNTLHQDLLDVVDAIHQVRQILPVTGEQPPLLKLIKALLGKFAGGVADTISDGQIAAALQQASPSLGELDKVLAALEKSAVQSAKALEPNGEWRLELNSLNTALITAGVYQDVMNKVKGDVAALLKPLDPAIDDFATVFPLQKFRQKVLQSIETHLLGSAAPAQLHLNLKQRLYDFDAAIRQGIDGVFQQANTIMRDLVSGSLAQVDNTFAKGLGQVGNFFGGGKLNGYAHIKGDSLNLLRVDLRSQMDLAGKLEFNSYAEIKELRSEGTAIGSSCSPGPGEKWTEVTMGADKVKLEWLGDLTVGVETKFTFGNNGLPINFVGHVNLDGPLKFEGYEVKELEFAVGVGDVESFASARIRAEFNHREFAGGFFAGKTCSDLPLRVANDNFADALGPVDPEFTGLYVYGECWFPLNEYLAIPSSCLLNLRGMAGLGIFYNANGPVFGGQFAYGVSGEVLCIAEMQGRLDLVGIKNGDDYTLFGKGTLTAEVGVCPACVDISKTVSLTCKIHVGTSDTDVEWTPDY